MIKAGDYIDEKVADMIYTLSTTDTRNAKESLTSHLKEVRKETGSGLTKEGLTRVLQGDYRVTDYTKPVLERLYQIALEKQQSEAA